MSDAETPMTSAANANPLLRAATANAAWFAFVVFASLSRYSGALMDYQWSRLGVFALTAFLSTLIIWLLTRRNTCPVSWSVLGISTVGCTIIVLWTALQIRDAFH